MLKSTPVIFLTICIVLAGCGGDSAPIDDTVIEEIDGVTYVRNGSRIDTTNFPYRFVLEQTFGAENEPVDAILGSASTFDVGPDGTVYVLDSRSNRLVAFGRDGHLIWFAGHAGEGPGELQRPRGLVLMGDTALVFSNHNASNIDFWSTNGEFLTSRLVPENVGLAPGVKGLAPSGDLIIGGYRMGTMGAKYSLVDSDTWEVRDTFFIAQKLAKELPMGFLVSQSTAFTPEFILAGSSSAEYAVSAYDYSGRLIREVSRDVDFLTDPGTANANNTISMYMGSSIMPMQRLTSGEWLVYIPWKDYPDMDEYTRLSLEDQQPEADDFVTLDVFDVKGKYIASKTTLTEANEMGAFKKVLDDYLYTSTISPFPQIRRYRIERK